MSIRWGEEYRGPGRADPVKTREQRAQELGLLLRTPAGREVIEYYFGKYTGTLQRMCPPAGLLMVQTVLNREYSKN
jgi:hypothetical protein